MLLKCSNHLGNFPQGAPVDDHLLFPTLLAVIYSVVAKPLCHLQKDWAGTFCRFFRGYTSHCCFVLYAASSVTNSHSNLSIIGREVSRVQTDLPEAPFRIYNIGFSATPLLNFVCFV